MHAVSIPTFYLLDPTLTLPNLTTLLEKVDWHDMSWQMDICKATLDMIHSSGGDDSQCRRKCWEAYLNEYPTPSWKRVADALYRGDYLEELEVVQREYLKGEWTVMVVTVIIHDTHTQGVNLVCYYNNKQFCPIIIAVVVISIH